MQDTFDPQTLSSAARQLARDLTTGQRALLDALHQCSPGSGYALQEASAEIRQDEGVAARETVEAPVDALLLAAIRYELHSYVQGSGDNVRSDVMNRIGTLKRETVNEMRSSLIEARDMYGIGDEWLPLEVALDEMLAPAPGM
jgi:hypothetical protein